MMRQPERRKLCSPAQQLSRWKSFLSFLDRRSRINAFGGTGFVRSS